MRERKLPQHQRSHRQRHRDCQDPVISTNTVKCICGKNAPESSFRLGLLPRAVTQNSGAMVTESLWAPFTSFIQLCGQLHWLLGHELLTADRSVACPWVSAHFDLLCFYHRAVHSLTTVTRVLLGLLSWRMNSFLCFHWIFYDSCEIKTSNMWSLFSKPFLTLSPHPSHQPQSNLHCPCFHHPAALRHPDHHGTSE